MGATEPLTGRPPPHSAEAEEYLLSCCLLDGGETVACCLESRLVPAAFYLPANQVVFEKLAELYQKGQPVGIETLIEELRTSHQLEAVGGVPYLMQVSARIPTTARAVYFIDKVRALHGQRHLINLADDLKERAFAFNGDGAALGVFRSEFAAQVTGQTADLNGVHDMKWDALLAFDAKNDPDCLMGKRFLCRTASCVIVAPSGVGKSVLALQLGACAALGRPFFGLQIHAPLRVLYIQAEDDLGDVGEAVQGFVGGYAVTPEQLAALKERLRIVRWNDAAGERFLMRLRSEHAKRPFDLVIVNPLFSFAGCNVSEQKELSPFLRNGFNPILNETRAAAVVVHHTNKPPADGKGLADIEEELRYLGSGSAELTNWARCYVTLKGVRSAGDKVFKMQFVKRGHRAGVVDDAGEPTTKVFIEHSPHGLCWLPSDYRPDQDGSGKFKPKFDLAHARTVYDPALSWPDNERAIADAQTMTPRAVRGHRHELEAVGK